MKEVLRDLLIAIFTAMAIPTAFFVGYNLMPLKKLGKIGMALGQRVAAPILGGARNTSGRIAHWGSSRGIVGRTAARIATGAVAPGGRRQMERAGEAYRKGNTERMIARGSYRMTPSSKMSADLLEKVSPDAIQRWVSDPAYQGDVEALRQMVNQTPSIRLSTAQRKALFSGVGNTPGVAGTPPVTIPGAPLPLGPPPGGALPDTDRPVVGGGAVGRWWSERPTVLPGVRQASQPRGVLGLGYVASHYLGGGSRQWAGWVGRAVGRPGSPKPPAPPPNPPSSWPAP